MGECIRIENLKTRRCERESVCVFVKNGSYFVIERDRVREIRRENGKNVKIPELG